MHALGDLDPYANDLERLQSAYSLTRSEADSLREECATHLDIIQVSFPSTLGLFSFYTRSLFLLY